jgi:hypothetical protein
MLAACSQAAAADSNPALPPAVHAVRLTTPVNLDGVLAEPVWRPENVVTDFKQRDPHEGAPATERTEVWVAYDDDALYVAARMLDSTPDSILARLARRDEEVTADHFTLYLDPYHDRRSGYYFMVNAAGTLSDGTLYNDGWSDASWDGVWDARARVDSLGWSVEMRIPYSQLRFPKAQAQVWGVDFRRNLARRAEQDYLVFPPKKESGFVSRFPDLVGLDGVSPGHAIEITPYVTSRADYLVHQSGDPFNDGSRHEGDGGADLRMAVGGRLTLNTTVNPDFGQVEVDPAVVNLSDVESFFEEKRPFFVEGISYFRCGNQGADSYWGFNWPEPMFFYSRRIGRTPQGDYGDADFADVPVGTRILGAAKLTGKLTPSWNFGTLHALTARETAELQTGGTRSRADVEPLTYYGVMRGLREFKERRQGLGFMSSAVSRSFRDGQLRDQLNDQSYFAATDGWFFLDRSQTWVVSGWSALSHLRGTTQRMTDVQTNSVHYLQRPDARHLGVDPGATSLTGFGSRYWLNKQKGNVIMNAALGFMDPKFDVQDMGYMYYANIINGHMGTGYRWTEPVGCRKYQDLLGALFASYDFDGNPVSGGAYLTGSTEFTNDYSWSYHAGYYPQTVNVRATRGGPRMLNRPAFELGTYFDTDSRSKLFYWFEANSSRAESGSWSVWLGPGIEWRPVTNLSFRLGPTFERGHEDAQRLETYDDPFATATYGKRYVFATLDQSTLAAGLRLNWALTPRLSLQVYTQPLVSAGDYSGFKELARPGSYAFNRYGEGGSSFDPATGTVDPDGPSGPAPSFVLSNPDFGFTGNPDFNVRSLRGNAVLRWEYLQGSTFYLVWTQTRSDTENFGEFTAGPSFRVLGDTQADNIFLAKVTYHFTL